MEKFGNKQGEIIVEFYNIYKTKIGSILIKEENEKIVQIKIIKEEKETLAKKQETALIKEAYLQIQEYLEQKRRKFTLPLLLKGTNFQMKVWQALRTIPYGETRSYEEIAKQIGNSKAARAVGMANHNNPILIVVPCHRVIGKNNKLVGFGAGLEVKQALLEIENM